MPPPGEGLTPPQAVGLLLMRPDERTCEQAAATDQLRALHLDIATAVALLDRFAALIRARDDAGQEERLARWLEDTVAGTVK